jgi:hypothetical protein
VRLIDVIDARRLFERESGTTATRVRLNPDDVDAITANLAGLPTFESGSQSLATYPGRLEFFKDADVPAGTMKFE